MSNLDFTPLVFSDGFSSNNAGCQLAGEFFQTSYDAVSASSQHCEAGRRYGQAVSGRAAGRAPRCEAAASFFAEARRQKKKESQDAAAELRPPVWAVQPSILSCSRV